MQAIGLDLWQVKSGSVFDNILITDDVAVAAAEAEDIKKTFDKEKEMKEKQDAEEKKSDDAAKDEDDEDEDEEDDKTTEAPEAVSYPPISFLVEFLKKLIFLEILVFKIHKILTF